MKAFELKDLFAAQRKGDKAYLEFLRVPDLSMGIYSLPKGGTDPQSPHTEDEVYYVLSGKAQIRVGDEDRSVHAGSIVYVAKTVDHRFHSIEEDLTVLVFFAPAEYSAKRFRHSVFSDSGVAKLMCTAALHRLSPLYGKVRQQRKSTQGKAPSSRYPSPPLS